MNHISDQIKEAAEMGAATILKTLLKTSLLHPDCPPKAPDSRGMTALMCAAYAGHAPCVRLLLPVSDALAQDHDGLTALMHAASLSQTACVKLLLLDSNLLAKNNNGLTALDIAVATGHTPLIKFMTAYAQATHQVSTLALTAPPTHAPTYITSAPKSHR